MIPRALLLPGFGGGADQPILLALDAALAERGIASVRAALTRGRPSPGLEAEVQQARELLDAHPTLEAYAGRSFGGRVLARLALQLRPRALVLLGFPLRSASGQRRRDDEDVLLLLDCPTLVVQGARDPLGPVRAIERLAARNPRLELEVVAGAAHGYGRASARAVRTAADWLARQLG